MRKLYFNLYIDVVDKKQALEMCYSAIASNKCKTLFFVNAHCFNVAQKNPEYRKALQSADIVLNDGIGLSLGSVFAKLKFKENMNGTDFIPLILRMASEWKRRVFFIGGQEGVALNAGQKLLQEFPHLNIVGIRNGYFTADEEIIEEINASKADILIVGMGVPRQELWINAVKNKLSHVRLCIAGGAIFDFLSGHIRRAPVWMRNHNLEWMYRLYLEPKRMWKRYLIGNFLFFLNISLCLLKRLKAGEYKILND